MKKNLLITGVPKSGKSTVLKNVVAQHQPAVGFVTNEIREKGERVGFEIEAHDKSKALFASIQLHTPIVVSKYHVDIPALESILPKVSLYNPDDVLYIDEIGEMQLHSEVFKKHVRACLDSSNVCVATLSRIYANDFIEEIKKRDDCIVIELIPENREAQEEFIKKLLRKIFKARRYVMQPERFHVEQGGITVVGDHGTKNITLHSGTLTCDCDFYTQYAICSHVLAVQHLAIIR